MMKNTNIVKLRVNYSVISENSMMVYEINTYTVNIKIN
jgi:hypothetical protein